MKKICCMACFIVFLGIISVQPALSTINKPEDLKHKGGKLGAFHALIIGIDNYKDSKLPELNGVTRCAKSFADVLKTKYGFSTQILLNKDATKDNLIKKIEEFTKSVKKEGTFVLYFAGHGEIDPSAKQSWWYPVDAKAGDYNSYIDCEIIQNALANMMAKDVLLISDSGYADGFFGSVHKLPPITDGKYYLNLYNKKSRWAITSGNNYPDKRKGCSTFSSEIINALNENTRPYLSVQQIFKKIKKTIRKNSSRSPRCRSLKNTGDRGGELIFVLLEPSPAEKEKLAASDLKLKKTVKKADAKAKKFVSTPGKRIGASHLSLVSNIKGSKIIMDGVAIGISSLKKFVVPPGSHKIEVIKEGYIPFSRNILVKRGEQLNLSPKLEKEKIVKSSGRLFLDVEPSGAVIKFTDKKLEYSSGMTLEKGRYRLEILLKYYDKILKDINIVAGEDSKLNVKLNPVQNIILKSLGKFVTIPNGFFMMGSPENELMRNPNEISHKVNITRRIYMQTKEVTVGQWRQFIKATSYKTEAEAGEGAYMLVDYVWENDREYSWKIAGFAQDDDHPVVSVSWNDTAAYIKWLNNKSRGKLKFRLPTEAEWEYACRAGSETAFSFGKCLSRKGANFDGNSKWNDCPVGKSSAGTVRTASYTPNAWDIYDMHGNVKEWCNDWFGNYPSGEMENPEGPVSGSAKIIRGGGWTDYVYSLRSAKRMNRNPSDSYSDTGFRLVIELNDYSL